MGIAEHKELEMPKFVHIVYVHPVELGKPNLHKVVEEQEFETKEHAEAWVNTFNTPNYRVNKGYPAYQAVYLGCVNDATGELV
jgi:hypothetical protein